MTLRQTPSIVSSVGLVLILVGALRDGDGTSGVVAFLALLILGATTFLPADARRGLQAAIVLASAAGLLVLGFLFEGLWGGRAELGDLTLALIGTALVVVDAAGRLLGRAEAPEDAVRWSAHRHRPRPVPSRTARRSDAAAHADRALSRG